MPVIDAHAHVYPEKIALRAADAIGEFYGVQMYAEGTPELLLATQDQCPITHFLIHSVATTARSVTTINDFLAEQAQKHPEFIAFGTIHQDFEDKEAEVERCIEMGLHGFKIHPDTQGVNLDDPRFMEFYEIIEGRMPVVIHTGDYRHEFSHPSRMARVLDAFPELVVDAAHFGGWSVFDQGYDILGRYERLFVDSSSTYIMSGARRIEELIRLWGTDRVMFGSDYPMWSPIEEYEVVSQGSFTDEEFEKIFCKNAERFTGVTVS